MVIDAEPADRRGELTLAISLEAARAYVRPDAVVADARRWSRYVGIVDNDTAAVRSFTREHGIDDDFQLGDRDVWRAMADVHAAADTPRHVFIGAGPEDRRIADTIGWEYLTAREAAEKAGWRLATENDTGASHSGIRGLAARIRRVIADRFD